MRRSTRIRWQTPVLLTSLDPKIEFHERCETLVVNLHGCAVRAGSTLPRGTPVQLQVNGNVIIGRVQDVVSVVEHENHWMLGIALECPGNFWGIQNAPKDWDSLAQAAPGQASRDTSDEQSQKSSNAEKLTIWPSAFGPSAQGTAAPSPREPETPSRDGQADEFRANEPKVVEIDSGQSQPDSSRTIEAGFVHLQAEIERRVAAEWMRLRSDAEQHVQKAGTQHRAELEQGLVAWREERAGIEGKVQELLRLRELVEVRLNAVADLLRREVVPLRDEMIDLARQELRALIRDFQEKTAADSTAHEKVMAAASTRFEQMQDACTQLVSHLNRRVDENQAAHEAVNAQLVQVLQARTEEESLLAPASDRTTSGTAGDQ